MTPEYGYDGTLLTLKNISLRLGGKLILRDINAEIKNIVRPDSVTQGQVVGFLGPSGIGKTQLLKIMAGLQPPTTGQVLINKEQLSVQRGQVGVVAQHYPLLEDRFVIDNLMLAAKQKGYTKNEARALVSDWIDRYNLSKQANLYPAQLSGGQRQRVAIAQQLLCSDHFILMDEPFSGLDHNMLIKVADTITEIIHENDLNTIIVVTHDVSAAVKIADTIWMMGYEKDADGKIIPGATIIETYDLLQMGLAWDRNVELRPDYMDFVKELKMKFRELDYTK